MIVLWMLPAFIFLLTWWLKYEWEKTYIIEEFLITIAKKVGFVLVIMAFLTGFAGYINSLDRTDDGCYSGYVECKDNK